MQQVSIDEAKTRLAELVDAALEGEEVRIAKGEQQLLLVRIAGPPLPRQAGTANGQIWMSEDFDEPLEDFKEYM